MTFVVNFDISIIFIFVLIIYFNAKCIRYVFFINVILDIIKVFISIILWETQLATSVSIELLRILHSWFEFIKFSIAWL